MEKALKKIVRDSISEIMPEIIREELQKSHYTNSSPTPPKEILNISEVCSMTGYARQTIYGMVSNGTIPYMKRPGSKFLRFRRSEILLWMDNNIKE